MNLQNLQADIAEAILTNDQNTDLIYPTENISIYQQNILSTLTHALKTAYPLIMKIIGDECFNVTAKKYIDSYPSLSGDLNEYGAYFSDFLATYENLHQLPYLAEVAKFEWTCHRIVLMGEHLPFDIKMLERIATDQYAQLHFNLSPACEIHCFQYPILRIIALCKNEIPGPIDLHEGGVNLLIYKRHFDVSLVSLSKGEFIFLTALQENKSLADSLELALEKDPLFKLNEKMPIWIKNRIIVDCNLLTK